MAPSQIDSVILSIVGERWTKVAMVIYRVAETMKSELPSDDEGWEAVSQCIEKLVDDGRLEAHGDTTNWRFSEIRLTPRKDS